MPVPLRVITTFCPAKLNLMLAVAPPRNDGMHPIASWMITVDLFDELDAGTFGPVDPRRMYATGISSGGYMSSRMADAYPGRFRALAIQSASYAWCSGPACTIPTLPEDHPPTLFLHGALDLTVPLYTMDLYHDELVDEGVEVG